LGDFLHFDCEGECNFNVTFKKDGELVSLLETIDKRKSGLREQSEILLGGEGRVILKITLVEGWYGEGRGIGGA